MNPATGQEIEPAFTFARPEDVELAAQLATKAFESFGRDSGSKRGAFLRKIAENIEAVAPDIVERAAKETALPQARLQSETARTCAQLRLFAQVAEEGSWVKRESIVPIPSQASRQAGYPLDAPPAGTGGRVRCQQLSAGIFRCWRRYRLSLGRRQSRDREGPWRHPGTSELVGRALQDACASAACPKASFRFCSAAALRWERLS